MDLAQHNIQNSTVLEVKSNFSPRFANNLILGYTNIHDYRNLLGGQSTVFPAVQINNVSTNPTKNYGGLGKLTPNAAGVTPTGHSIQISFDIINFGNFINKSWGRQYFVPNTFNSTMGTGLTQVAYADASGTIGAYNATTFNRPAFTFSSPATYSIDQLASRW